MRVPGGTGWLSPNSPFNPKPADSSRFSLYGVSMVRPYDARSTVPLLRHRVRDAEPRLERGRARQAIVVIEPQAEIERRVTGLDVVLDVRGLLLDRERLVVGQR